MATTNYYSVNGVIQGEATGGAFRRYGSDALGSVLTTFDSGGAVQNTYRFTPFGGTLSKVGVAPDPMHTWVGTAGYRATSRSLSGFYVRNRHYATETSQWTS